VCKCLYCILGTHSFGYMSRSGMAGSYGSSILNLSRSLNIFSHSGCTILYSYQQCITLPFLLHFHHHLLCFLPMIVILTGVKWNISLSFWFAFPLRPRMLSILSCIYWSSVILLRIVCSFHLLIYSMGCWFFEVSFLNFL
jgi:hypothetical protein